MDCKLSLFANVDSGVPQGTVLDPLRFLLNINDLTSAVNSKVSLFADDCQTEKSKQSVIKMICEKTFIF